jgi:hypothetical protein
MIIQTPYPGDTMVVDYGEYNGKKLIVLKRDGDDRFPFSFGKAKAKMIVENYDAIKKFAEEE